MKNAQIFEFENWFDIFVDSCRALKYRGPIDKDSARMDYDSGLSPESAAKKFVEEMNS